MLGSDIKKLVITKLEEHSPFGNSDNEILLSGGDAIEEVKPIYKYIDDTIAEAANEVLSYLPIHILPKTPLFVAPIPDKNDKAIGIIPLPVDFLRLHTLQMKGWTCPIHRVTLQNEPSYKLQFNRWTRGTEEKPVVIYPDNYIVESAEFAESTIRDEDMAL